MTHDATHTPSFNYPLVALRDLITLNNPRRTCPDLRADTPVTYTTLSNISVRNGVLAPMYCRMGAIPTRALQFSEGDVLVPRQLIALRIGKAALAPVLATPSFCASNLYVIQVDPHHLDGAYLLHVLRQQYLVQLIDAFLKDETGIHPPTSAFFHQLLLALPPLADQRDIAAMASNRLISHIGRQQQAIYLDAHARVVRDAPDLAQAA